MSETTAPRVTAIGRVYLIIALFVALILCLVLLFQFQMDLSVAIRVYVGGEGLWAKAQKDAVHSLEHYTISRDESDYQVYLRLIQVPQGDQKARMELQKPHPNLEVVREGYLQGRNHPVDIEYAIPFFLRFQHTAYMSRVIRHWTAADHMIAEMNEVAGALHEEISSGRNNPDVIRACITRLDNINRRVTLEEDLFSSTLAEASRWANEVSRDLTYAIALLFVALGIGLSWPIITRIRATENALSESEERYRSIFEHVNDIIYTVEADGTFSSVGPSCERMLGWSPADWIGRPFAQIVHPDDLPLMQALFLKALAGKPLPVFQVRILTKAGGYLDAEIVASPIHRAGSITILGVVRDISERKQREEAIRQLNEELEAKVKRRTRQLLEAQDELVRNEKLAVLGQVAGTVGHELRNPLGVMSNAVFYLQTVLPDADATTREYLNIIKSEIAGAERIVSDLLDSVRAKPPRPEAVSVRELLEQTLRKLSIPSSVTVTLETPESLPALRADPLQIHQVLRNLITNGIEAMPEGGKLEIRAAEDASAGSITVGVKDSGTGIALEIVAKLFQPLFTTKARGIGLGLVVVKNLTEANGGTVDVQSEPGKGATFSITLPIERPAVETA